MKVVDQTGEDVAVCSFDPALHLESFHVEVVPVTLSGLDYQGCFAVQDSMNVGILNENVRPPYLVVVVK